MFGLQGKGHSSLFLFQIGPRQLPQASALTVLLEMERGWESCSSVILALGLDLKEMVMVPGSLGRAINSK